MTVNNWPYNTSRWRKLRRAKLLQSPLCEHCSLLGRVVSALIVDHVKAIRNGGEPFPALDRLQSLCQACHNRKTASDMRNENHVACGFDVNGDPIDETHEWHRGGDKDGKSSGDRPAGYSKTYLVSDDSDPEEIIPWV